MRSILYPPPVDFRFEKDSYKFVAFLAVIAAIGFLYTLVTKVIVLIWLHDLVFKCIIIVQILNHVPAREIVLQALDLITIVVPPALPAAMTVGRLNAQIRLKDKKIFCISPRTINVSGSINCVCFDKVSVVISMTKIM